MKKVLLFAFLAAAATSQAEYLYWQVSDTMIENDAYLKEHVNLSDGYTYKAIMHYGTVGEDGSWSGDGVLRDARDSGTSRPEYGLGGDGLIETSYQVNLGQLDNASSYSYYIEIVKYATAGSTAWYGVAKSETKSYAQLSAVENGVSFIGDIAAPSVLVPWTGGAFAAPEPSSAMLVLVGMALVALKRKRA